MITKLRLENWKTHKDSELEFDKGTNVLIGKMGSGKTSVIEAICYALFGTFPALSRKEVSIEEVILSKPYEEDNASISLEFKYANSNYLVNRKILKKKTNQATLHENGRLIAGPQVTEVNKKIEDLLKINYEIFSRAIFSEQNQIDYFLKLSPQLRKQSFDEMLALDRYEKVRAGAVKVRNKMKTLLALKKDSLVRLSESFDEKELKDILSKIEETKERLGSINSEISQKEKIVREFEVKIKELEKTRIIFENSKRKQIECSTKLDAIQQEIAGFDAAKYKISEIKKQVEILEKEIEKINDAKSEINSLNALFEDKTKRKISLNDDILAIKSKNPSGVNEKNVDEKISGLNKKIKDLEDLIEASANDIEKLEEKRSKTKEEIGCVSERINSHTKEHDNLKGLHAKCPICKQAVDETLKKNLSKEVESNISKEERTLDGLKGELRGIEKKIELTRAEEKEQRKLLETLNKDIQVLESSKKDIQIMLENEKQARLLEKEIDELDERLGKASKLIAKEDISEKKKAIENNNEVLRKIEKSEIAEKIKKDLKEVESQLKEIKYDRDEEIEIRAIVEREKETIKSLHKELEGKKEWITEAEKRKFSIESMEKNILELKKEIETIEKSNEKIAIFTNTLIETQNNLRTLLIETINNAMEDLWQRIYPYKDYSSLKIDISEGDYTLMIKTRTKWQRIEGLLSGGERSAAALTIRLAFSLVLTSNLSWLILDEPTHNLDRMTISRLSLLMREHMPTLIDQIFLITHDSEMENAASAKIYFLERNKDEEGITKPIVRDVE